RLRPRPLDATALRIPRGAPVQALAPLRHTQWSHAGDRRVREGRAIGRVAVEPQAAAAYRFFGPLVSADQLPPTSGATPGLVSPLPGTLAAGALEARDASPLGAGRSRGTTRGSSGVIWKLSRKMPGLTSDSGLTITSGRAIGPWMANVVPKMPAPRGAVSSGPRSGMGAGARIRPDMGT